MAWFHDNATVLARVMQWWVVHVIRFVGGMDAPRAAK